MTTPSVRDATTADAAAVAAIYGHYVADTAVTFDEQAPSTDDWTARLAAIQAKWPFLVLDIDGGVAGFAFVKAYHERSAYRFTVENSIYLHPAHTGRGLGRLLLDALLTAAQAAGARQVVAAIADTGNPASIELHSSAGFRHVGSLTGVGSEHGRWVDVHYMQRSLA